MENTILYTRGDKNMEVMCEICHKEEATGKIWLNADQSPIRVAGTYQVCSKHGGKKKK